jgi:hypothetical protein
MSEASRDDRPNPWLREWRRLTQPEFSMMELVFILAMVAAASKGLPQWAVAIVMFGWILLRIAK